MNGKYTNVVSDYIYDRFCFIMAKSKLDTFAIFDFLLKYYKRKNIVGIHDNLINIGFSENDAKYFSEKESYMKIRRDISSYSYNISNAEKLKRTIDGFKITNGLNVIKSAVSDEHSIISILHCGFYWEAVAKIVTLDQEKEFIIPILDLQHDLTRRSITALNLVCKNLEIIDIKDKRKAAIKIMKSVRNGKKLIIFSDLPTGVGDVVFGVAGFGIFMGKNASITSGPMEIAKMLKKNMVYVSSDPDLDNSNHNIVHLGTLLNGDISIQNNINIMESIIKKKPHLWAYIDRIENYFQRGDVEK